MAYLHENFPKLDNNIIGEDFLQMAFQLGEDNIINVQGFGVFDVKKKLEHVAVHPSTRQLMLVPPKMDIKFKPSQTIKDKLK